MFETIQYSFFEYKIVRSAVTWGHEAGLRYGLEWKPRLNPFMEKIRAEVDSRLGSFNRLRENFDRTAEQLDKVLEKAKDLMYAKRMNRSYARSSRWACCRVHFVSASEKTTYRRVSYSPNSSGRRSRVLV